MNAVDLRRLERRLGYHFQEKKLLKQALTHCSYGANNNERMEFLGDSILSFVIANALIQQFSQQSEGELSRLRAFLVNGEMLAEIAKDLALGDFMFLGQGELKSGGFRRASILADALEAIIAAVFLDAGIKEAQALILRLYQARLADDNLQSNLKDAKTQLQEWLQARKKALPEYNLIHTIENEGEKIFYIQCKVPKFPSVTEGKASNRRKAEQIAAIAMLELLKGQV